MKSLEQQMAFYAAYHRHPMNRATHFVGVPIIIYAIMVILAVGPMRFDVGFLPFALSPTVAILAWLLVYYFLLDVALALAMVVVLGGLFAAAEYTVGFGGAVPFVAFGVAFVGGWIIQLVGHGVWEKRKPALASNLFQVFVSPIFLVAEVFFALGLKRDVYDEVERLVPGHMPGADAA